MHRPSSTKINFEDLYQIAKGKEIYESNGAYFKRLNKKEQKELNRILFVNAL
jgi:hypothetical protein